MIASLSRLATVLLCACLPVPASAERTRFDEAFRTLQQARKGPAGAQVVVLSARQRLPISRALVPRGVAAEIVSTRELLFDGRRAHLRLTTTSAALRPQVSSATVRIPLGRLLGWYGRYLLSTQLPELTSEDVQRGLSRLPPAGPSLLRKLDTFLGEAYAAFGRGF